MGSEKQSSKTGGGYVGGLLQLFEWNGKSRKNLFSNKSDLLERSKQVKRSDGNLPITRLHPIEEDENGGSSVKGSSDYSCASSVTDDEGYGSRAPGVVARLMGLDSLPTPTVAETYSTPFDSCSLQDGHYHRTTPEYHNECQILHSSNQPNKFECFSRNPVESRSLRIQNRPIGRFQTETLPPKSAKSIPITRHKLLSPIKSPGFTPTKNAAHIMEVAAKIIEARPQATSKGKMPSTGSTSIPLKVRDIKEKMEAAQRPPRFPEASQRLVESNAVKYHKGPLLNKSWNVSEDTPQFRVYLDSEESNSVASKTKGRSISLAIQAKVNVQRREGLSSSIYRSSQGPKEQNNFKSNQQLRIQSNTQKNIQKKKSSTLSASDVLRQNNQKQNCLTNNDKLPSKSSTSNQQGRKPLSGDASSGKNKTLKKVAGNSKVVGSRKIGLEAADIEKEVPSSRIKNIPPKKRSIDGDFHFEENGIFDTVLMDKNKKSVVSNIARDGHSMWAEDNRRKGTDVVSFTFTCPMTKAIPYSQSSGVLEKINSFYVDSCGKQVPAEVKNTTLSSLGLNVIGGDSLSILLEKKLRELTYGVESSCRNLVKAGPVDSSVSALQDLVSSLNAVSTTPTGLDKGSQFAPSRDKFGSICDPCCSSTDVHLLKMNHNLQGGDVMGECNSSSNKVRKELDCRHPSPVSVLEPSSSNESCNYSDSGDSESTNGSKQYLSVKVPEVFGSSCSRKFISVEAEAEYSDSASSNFTGTRGRKHVTTFNFADSTRSNNWELEYVREILCNLELMFKDFALGRAREIINPHLFHQLENRKTGLRSEGEKDCALRRKMVFDCVSECLDLRCRRYVGGSCRTWAKGVAMVRRKDWLAEGVYKEISGWRSMEDWMEDELVEKDMSSQYGRWLDFETEAFEVGLEIEKGILGSLVDEVIADIV